MNLHSVELENFTCWTEGRFVFPQSGKVVVTGRNGRGKSSVLEAVVWTIWGKTIRGASPIPPEAETTGTVRSDQIVVQRSRKDGKGTKTKLAWCYPGEGEWRQGSTPTETQRQIESVVGPFSVFRRARVFTSADAAHFTLASDGERKRLLEQLIGLEQFDEALKACRADKQAAEREKSKHDTAGREAAARVEEMDRQLDEARRALEADEPEDPTPLEQKADKLREHRSEVVREISQLRDEEKSVRDDFQAVKTQHEQAKAEAERLDRDACPTCGQEIAAELREQLQRRVADTESERMEASEVSKKRVAEIRERLGELEEERDKLDRKLSKLDSRIQQARQDQQRRERQQASIEGLEKRRADKAAEKDREIAEAEKHAHEVAVLRQVEGVLGLKGVRASLLAKTLSGIEEAAAGWLARLAPGASLHLKPERKGADHPIEAIGIEVSGLAGGRGYAGASQGERRRLDVAILLALADVASARAGSDGAGTLFFDEVLDSLDEEGRAAMADLADELTADRAAVIISHVPGYARQLEPDVLWDLDSG